MKITTVDKASPAEGVIAVGDVLLGVGGKPLSYDPRTEIGLAITAAETTAAGGKLALTRWRAGNVEEVEVLSLKRVVRRCFRHPRIEHLGDLRQGIQTASRPTRRRGRDRPGRILHETSGLLALEPSIRPSARRQLVFKCPVTSEPRRLGIHHLLADLGSIIHPLPISAANCCSRVGRC